MMKKAAVLFIVLILFAVPVSAKSRVFLTAGSLSYARGFYDGVWQVTPVLAAGERGGIVICGDGEERIGAELLTNEDMELETYWSGHAVEAGEEVTRSGDQKHGGSYSMKLTNMDADEGARSDADIAWVAGGLYQMYAWGYGNGVADYKLRGYDGTAIFGETTITNLTNATWLKVYSRGTPANSGTSRFYLLSATAGDNTLYWDDASVKRIYSPLNAILCEIDRTTGHLYLKQRLAGTETDLIDAAVTYADDHVLTVVKRGETVWVFYSDSNPVDNVLIDDAQTVSSEKIRFNRNHYTTGTDSSFTGFSSIQLGMTADLYRDANAAAVDTEADDTTGWTSSNLDGTGANIFESQSTHKTEGSYAIQADSSDTPANAARFERNLSDLFSAGDIVRVSFDARHSGNDGDWVVGIGDVPNSPKQFIKLTNTDTTWASYEMVFIYSADRDYFIAKEWNSLGDGGIYLDNLSLRKIN